MNLGIFNLGKCLGVYILLEFFFPQLFSKFEPKKSEGSGMKLECDLMNHKCGGHVNWVNSETQVSNFNKQWLLRWDIPRITLNETRD